MSVTCSNGHENLDGMSFCEDCGVELTSLSDTINTAPPVPAPPDNWAAPQPEASSPSSVPPAPTSDASSPSPVAAPVISDVQVLVPEDRPAVDPVSPVPPIVPPLTATLPVGAVVTGTAYLEVTQGPFVGRRYAVTEPVCLIGRWDMDSGAFPQIDLTDADTDAKVSRKHARITTDDAGYHLEDLGSLNGTSHQGSTRLVPGDLRQLSDGDVVIIGRLFLRFATS